MGHRTTPRTRRVAEEIQRDLAEILRTEVKDPRVGMVTITFVDVAADMGHAKVHFTHLAGKAHAAEAIAALMRTQGFLRSALARRLSLYTVPQLSFAYDDSIESGMHLSQLIDDAVAADRRNEPVDDAADADRKNEGG
jgi:ribosome-binding factor A